MDTILQDIANALLADSSVTSLVGSRIYQGQVALIGEAVFPCLTISRRMLGTKERNIPISDFDLTLSGISTNSDESWAINQAATTILEGYVGRAGSNSWCLWARSTPITVPVQEAETLYHTHSIFSVYAIG